MNWDIISWFQNNNSAWGVVILFSVVQLVNVLLSTMRSVILIKGGRKVAVMFNVVSYSISVLSTALIAGVVDCIPITVIVTAITNLVGTWLGLSILDHMRKEQCWEIRCTVRKDVIDMVKKVLDENNIDYLVSESKHKRVPVSIWSYSKEESKVVKEIVNKYNIKYMLNTNNKSL